MIRELIPDGWRDALLSKVPSTVFDKLDAVLTDEYQKYTVYPTIENIFNAINGTWSWSIN